jgi:predicted nicotinamide N-methyase
MGFLPFQTALRQLCIGELRVQLQCVTNIDELIDDFLMQSPESEAVRDEQIPYWASLWPSALGMAQYLLQSGIVQPGMRVTEIGCGLGLPGIVAGMLGAEVLLTDYLPEPLKLAAANWSLNCASPPHTALLDWRKPESRYAADLLLASDVAYEARSFEPLPRAFRTLCVPGGRILVSEPDRSFARRFFEELPRQGFAVHSHTETVELDGNVHGIRLHRLL